MHRSIKTESLYQRHRRTEKKGICDFCELAEMRILKTYKYFRILNNRFPYSTWDSGEVANHLLLVPIRHVSGLFELKPEELKEYIILLFEFEKMGYDQFTRAGNNVGKSLSHAHTHLIKVTQKKFNLFFFLRHPYVSLPFYF